jgi:hypothetical protein
VKGESGPWTSQPAQPSSVSVSASTDTLDQARRKTIVGSPAPEKLQSSFVSPSVSVELDNRPSSPIAAAVQVVSCGYLGTWGRREQWEVLLRNEMIGPDAYWQH